MNSKTALSVMTYMMGFLLGRPKYSASYADLVFDQIKLITFHFDGEEHTNWDSITMQPVWPQLERAPWNFRSDGNIH